MFGKERYYKKCTKKVHFNSWEDIKSLILIAVPKYCGATWLDYEYGIVNWHLGWIWNDYITVSFKVLLHCYNVSHNDSLTYG